MTAFIDFPRAAWLAIREVFPTIEVKGCAIHWSQAVWRHDQECGLGETYRRRVGVYSFIRMLLALQFLLSAHIWRAFQSLVERATSTPTITLVDYIRRQWMEHSIFSIDDWSVYRQDIRTNNDVEGWHHRLNSKAGGSGLGFYRLVPMLRREAELVEEAVTSGDLDRARTTRTRTVDKALDKLWTKYANGELKTSEFLSKVGCVYGVRT